MSISPSEQTLNNIVTFFIGGDFIYWQNLQYIQNAPNLNSISMYLNQKNEQIITILILDMEYLKTSIKSVL